MVYPVSPDDEDLPIVQSAVSPTELGTGFGFRNWHYDDPE